ncbi:Helix-turn-helix domain-containing protein [Streptosporangium subroseum]|uniref:Helix-turn-helix domain-containing protein n=1 Tax=Streptosporangium subroseum TaxID=106412 RepID=A0A239P628_9ACTN|nr:helix-turn-helix transcriptional regulator [Streptosporangium subroseum]SNT62546.1 Helix-turn-helix domain-containing protein [Streptosporangium subroseum]
MSPTYSPTVRLRRLARELRKMREESGLGPEDAAARLGWSRSKVSRIETGRTRASAADVADACDLYGAGSSVRAGLIQLAKEVRQRGWWTAYADVFTGSYIGLEDEATLIHQWEVQLVPGLLQTEDYARMVISAGRPQPHDADDVHRRVMARMARRTLLSRPDAPNLCAVLDEGAIRRPIGGPELMRNQLEALLIAARRPNVTIRILPYSIGAHAGLEGAFTVLSFAEEVDPDVAYVEGTAGDVYIESSDHVDRYKMAFARICDAALPPENSMGLIADTKERLAHD